MQTSNKTMPSGYNETEIALQSNRMRLFCARTGKSRKNLFYFLSLFFYCGKGSFWFKSGYVWLKLVRPLRNFQKYPDSDADVIINPKQYRANNSE